MGVVEKIIREVRDVGKGVLSDFAGDLAKSFAESRTPELTRLITRENNLPYLWRYYFDERKKKAPGSLLSRPVEKDIEGGNFGVFVHRFVASDTPNEVHSHPWEWSVSLILAGAYREIKYTWKPKLMTTSTETRRKIEAVELTNRREALFTPFDINTIDYHDAHRVELIGKECWTLFVHGPRKSTWGFANEGTGAFREIRVKTFEHGRPIKEKIA